MNKKTLLGLSAILSVLIGTLACSYSAGPYCGRTVSNQDGSMLRADGVPAPPFPPQELSSPSDLRADGVPAPPFPWPGVLSLPPDARVS
jgi:hypothetical protein